ncbi:hypothetical protein C5167_004138 [Papaver somniferum]|nr:hypothetical protein C5167_004138 [Papaver somniferum]
MVSLSIFSTSSFKLKHLAISTLASSILSKVEDYHVDV